MKKHLLLIIFLFFAGWQAQAQTDKEKELLQMEQDIASGNLSEEDMYDLYNSLISNYAHIDFDKFKYYGNKAIAFARKKKNAEQEASFLLTMVRIYSGYRILDSVPVLLDKALKLIEGKSVYGTEWGIHDARGDFFVHIGDFENAIEAFLNAMETNEKQKKQRIANNESIRRNYQREIASLGSIAYIYAEMLNKNKQIEYLLQIVEIIENNLSPDLTSNEYRMFLDLAHAYMNIGKYDEALPLIEKAHKFAAADEDYYTMAYCMKDYAEYYRHHREHKRANDYAKQALQLAEKTNNPHFITDIEPILAKSYIFLHDYKTALFYAESALSKLSEDAWVDLRYLYLYLSIIYAAMNDIEQSFDYAGKFMDVMRKVSDENMHNALQNMEVKYEVKQKEQAHQAEIKRHQTLRYIFIGGLLTATLLIALLIYIVMLRNKRNRELAEMNATKDKFFSIISHDLKNPAIAQRDALQLLLDNSGQWDAESLSKYYRELLKSADSQVVLLYNLLNWAQVQTGRMPYLPAPFDLAAALQPDIVLIKNMAEQKGINLNIQMPEKVIVTGDDNMLAIVVRNLLTNAVKFTSADGTVTLNIVPSGTGVGYIISISDTGTGMTEEQLQNLFRMDKKRSKLGTAGEQGSGLGLIVCKELVEKHGSTLHVDSEERMGSRVWFEIV
ncbi:MAG: tetratricopeptide repeat-containing sensor histidine kinase [Bacteroidetes bacterium]|nr:tetratricopeptide repeat-containing sensor histidine kinase [Bacteroidota bacterium]MCL2302604.1 tetratricopeptide repeat-containing sensor histidine kinase [Lentimicrobiaceae bacterium]